MVNLIVQVLQLYIKSFVIKVLLFRQFNSNWLSYFFPIQNDEVDPLVTNMVDLLVKCAREKDSYVSGLAGRCLGILGAIDPGTTIH